MIPAKFKYMRPKTLSKAMMLLSQHGEKAAILAGGHSLLTQLKHRKRRVDVVVDLASIGLDKVVVHNDLLEIGAMAKQRDVAVETLDTQWKLLSEIASVAADPMIRNRGTLVGALCALEHGGDWVPAALALDAEISILDDEHEKSFLYADLLESKTSFPPVGTIVTGVSFSAPPSDAIIGYRKFKHSAIGWSVVSVAYSISGSHVRIAVSGALEKPARIRHLENHLAVNPDHLADTRHLNLIIEESLNSLSFRSDQFASSEYRRHRLKLMLQEIVKYSL